MSKEQTPMKWTKRQTQMYGAFCAILGVLLGISATMAFCIFITN